MVRLGRHAELLIKRRTWLLSPGSLYLLWIGSLLWLSSCREGEKAQEQKPYTGPVQGMRTSLEDEVAELANGQIGWSTYWKLCWEKYPQAEAYELQTITSEGSSARLKRVNSPCYRLQVAAGKNNKTQGLLNRKQLLSLQTGQLAYKVRAVIKGHTYSEWSKVIQVQQVDSLIQRE